MKWLRTLVLFDQGSISATPDWADIHKSYVAAINSIDFPAGSGKLTLRKKVRTSGGQWLRNGVVYLKTRFLGDMTQVQGWKAEGGVDLNRNRSQEPIRQYPGGQTYHEPITSDFGGFDFVTVGKNGLRVAIEWETGNISSSHRSMNKLAIALCNGVIDAGILIVPSRQCYEHLTDRIGNISELSGYLAMWAGLSSSVAKGLLAVSVVEQDDLTDDPAFPYLPTGNDGRAKEGRAKLL
jgi:Restriction endonuclease BamHI